MDNQELGIEVEKYMGPVRDALVKYIKWPSAEYTEIYNRAWEAVYNAIKDRGADNEVITHPITGSVWEG